MEKIGTPEQINPDFSLDHFLMTTFGPVANELITHIGTLRNNNDVESVHHARVAIRKAQSHVKTFAPMLKKKPRLYIAQELNWLNSKIAPVRNADVLLEIAQGLKIEKETVWSQITRLLDQDRNSAFASLNDSLAKNRVDALLTELTHFALHPPIKKKVLAKSASARKTLTVQCVSNTWTALFAEIEKLSKRPKPARLHRVRVIAKRCRYAYEVAQSDGLLTASRHAPYAESLQNKLGQVNDIVMFLDWLKKQSNIPESAKKEYQSQLKSAKSVTRKQLLKTTS